MGRERGVVGEGGGGGGQHGACGRPVDVALQKAHYKGLLNSRPQVS